MEQASLKRPFCSEKKSKQHILRGKWSAGVNLRSGSRDTGGSLSSLYELFVSRQTLSLNFFLGTADTLDWRLAA
jgi:hypothetical protein